MPSQITGHFTCDNSYSVWKGNKTQVGAAPLLEATNTEAGQIRKGEDLPPIEITPECYLYIVAWSDDAVYQGLIGSFTGAITIHTGDSRWRVLPTGINKDNNQFPTSVEINSAIAAAQPSDWKVPFNGAPNGGPPWPWSIQGVSTQAQWMWYDSGKDPNAKYPVSPYVPFNAFNHDEFLIFRISCKEFSCGACEEDVKTANQILNGRADLKEFTIVANGQTVPPSCQLAFTNVNFDPVFTLEWGDGPSDQFESEDFEVIYIRVHNPFRNLIYRSLTIFDITITPNQTLPNGDDSVMIIPAEIACFDEIQPCSYVSRDFALVIDHALVGTYQIAFDYCIGEIAIVSAKDGSAAFDINVVAS